MEIRGMVVSIMYTLIMSYGGGVRWVVGGGEGINITHTLSVYNGFSNLMNLLNASGVWMEVDNQTSMTLLAPNDQAMQPLMDSSLPMVDVANVLRYHVLLQFMGMDQLGSLPNGTALVTTLYQSTGTAQNNYGFLNLTHLPDGSTGISLPVAGAGFLASVVKSVIEMPYSLSIIQISKLMVPVGISAPSPGPAVPVNVTTLLETHGQFSSFIKLLKDTKVDEIYEMQANATPSGITIFAPIDEAFSSMSTSLDKLSASQKVDLLKYHALPNFHTFPELKILSNPVTNTLASPSTTSNSYTLNLTQEQGTLVVSSGLIEAHMTNSPYSTYPCLLVATDKVLWPKELANETLALAPSTTPSIAPSTTPSIAPSSTPSIAPSTTPSISPSTTPSISPTTTPSISPSSVLTPSPSSSTTNEIDPSPSNINSVSRFISIFPSFLISTIVALLVFH